MKTTTPKGIFWGEIAPLPGRSKESLKDAEKEIKNILLHGGKPALPSVQFALFAAQNPISLPISSFIWEEAKDVLSCMKKGGKVCKVKVGHFPVEKAVEVVKEIKREFPEKILRLDASQKWTLKEALFFAKHFQKEDFAYLEEPVQSFEELFLFSKTTSFPIGVDESLITQPLEKIFSIPSLAALIVKPTIWGGLDACRKLLDEAKKRKLSFILGSAFESGVGLYAIASLACALEHTEEALGIDTYRFLQEDVLKEPPLFSEGKVVFAPIQLKENAWTIFSAP